jgi:hypothetical protein
MVMMSNRIRRATIVALLGVACLVAAALSATAATLPGKPPVATDDTGYTTSSDAPVVALSIPAPGLLANDISPNVPLASLTAIKVAGPTNGAATVNADGSFVYTPTANFFGADSFTYKVNDGTNDSNVATVSINVTHINQPPVNAVPAATQLVEHQTAFTFSAANSNAISISDPDAGTNPVKLSLSVLHGTLTLSGGGAGLTFVDGTANGQAAVHVTGTITNINTALAGMTYIDDNANVSTSDTLTVLTDDQGNSGSGGAKTDSDTVAITIHFNQPPVPGNDTFNGANSAVGNTLFALGQNPTGPVVTVSGNVLSNDTDPDADTITITGIVGCADAAAPFDCATTQGGTVSLAADGTFTFLPKAGFVGDDTFQYTINDGHAHPVNGTVTIHVANMVWYVNAANTPGPGDGRSTSPFTSAASVNAVSGTGDTVFVYSGTYTGGLGLKDNQTALGQPAGLLVATHQLVAAGGTRPSISNSGGDGITLGTGNTIDQINLGDASGFALSGGAAGTLGISNMTVNNTTGGGVSITGGALTVTLDSLTSTGGTNGINLVNDTGTFTANGGAISGATTAGVSLDTNTAALTYSGTVTSTSTARSVSVANKTGGAVALSGAVTDTGTGISITGNSASTSVSFTSTLSLTTGANTALTATGAGTITATNAANTINAATGQALNLSGVTFNASFSSVTSGGGTNNVSLTNVPGALTMGGGTLSGASGTAFSVNGSNPTVTYQGDITQNNAARLVDIQNTTGNSVTFNTGTLTGGASSTGVNINAANGSVSFANLNLGTSGSRMGSQAVTITGGNSTATYSLGTVNIFTNGGQGIVASNADGTINITNGTVDTTGGRAINISGPAGLTTLGVTLTKVASTSSTTNGLTLNNTSGTFVVNGDGASDPANTTRGRTTAKNGGGLLTLGSGGTISGATNAGVLLTSAAGVTLRNVTIQNNGSGINTGGNGITWTNATGLTLDNVLVSGHAGNYGLHGTTTSSLTMVHTEMSANATTAGVEASHVWDVRFDDLAGSSSITHSLFFNAHENIVGFEQGTLNSTVTGSMTIGDSEFRDTATASPGNDGISLNMHNSANFTLSVDGSTFLRDRSNGIQYTGNDSSGGGTITVTNSTFDQNATDVNIAHQGLGKTVNFNITGNNMRQAVGGVGNSINLFLAGLSNGGTLLQGKIQSNTIGKQSVTDSGSSQGKGIDLFASGAGTLTVLVDSNVVRQIHQDDAFRANSAAATGTMNVTVTHNDFSVNTASGLGIYGILISSGGQGGVDSGTVCANLSSNTAAIGDPTLNGIFVQSLASASVVNLQGYGGAANNLGQINSFLNTTATTVNPAAGSVAANGGTIKAAPSACATPP